MTVLNSDAVYLSLDTPPPRWRAVLSLFASFKVALFRRIWQGCGHGFSDNCEHRSAFIRAQDRCVDLLDYFKAADEADANKREAVEEAARLAEMERGR